MRYPFEIELAQSRWRIAALKVEVKFLKLSLKIFNPLQPRVPSGSSDGGQWTGNSPLIQPTTERQRDRLSGEEIAKDPYLNHHILDQHVGKSDEEMIARVASGQQRIFFGLLPRPLKDIRDGSFDTVESARGFITETLERNKEEVQKVVDGVQLDAYLQTRFGYPTGREAVSIPEDSPIRMRTTYGVGLFIAHDSSMDRGYRIITAFPENQ